MQNKTRDEIIDEGIKIINELNKKFMELKERGELNEDTSRKIEKLIQDLTEFLFKLDDFLWRQEKIEGGVK
jgi:polyhydroxyalkanoate synthesis regulator phasin